MPLTTKSYEQFLSDLLVTWAANVYLKTGYPIVPNLESGDPLLALFQAHALAGLEFIQSQVVTVNLLTRAQSSRGADLDSFMAQFKFPRKPAAYATGPVKFSVRTVQATNILIKPGVVIQTVDGKIKYQVIEDVNKTAWSTTLGGYVLPAGELQVEVTVRAVEAGRAANVNAGTLVQIASQVTGIAFVTNLVPMENGADPESDAAYRIRFQLFINTVNKRTTPGGILSEALAVPGVVACKLVENEDTNGNPQPGYGYLVIDDGSGQPPSPLVATVQEQVFSRWAKCRGLCIEGLTVPAERSLVTIALNVKVNPDAPAEATVLLDVKNAILNYVNALEIGETLYLHKLTGWALAANPWVVTVQPGSVKINNTAADFTVTNKVVVRTDTLHTTIGTY